MTDYPSDFHPVHQTCESCEESFIEEEMVHLGSEDIWFCPGCAEECNIIECPQCTEIYDGDDYKKCPECGQKAE